MFLHVGWARDYQGAPDDPPLGKFGHFKDHDDAGEALNFKDYEGTCFGYAPRSAIDLSRLGALERATYVDGITVVWTATDPAGAGRYIVGWYRSARVYATLQPHQSDKIRPGFLAQAPSKDCKLVPVDERTFYVPSRIKGWPGIASAFFASQTLSEADLDKVLDYVGGKPSTGFYNNAEETSPVKGGGSGWPTVDPELRAKVEVAAIKVVTAHYRALGWEVKSVENENLGWDLEVTRGGRLLLVEVKGRGGEGSVELTPNEYGAMQDLKLRMSFRLAIVHNSLSKSPTPSIFEYVPEGDRWKSKNGMVLKVKTMTGAIASF